MNFYYQLNNYCIFIASRYFNSIEDFINLEMTARRFRGNLSKFFYNPISVNETTIQFFPYLKTLHLYNRNDPVIMNQNIQFHCVWFPMEYNEYKMWNGFLPQAEFKRIYYKDTGEKRIIELPKEVNELNDLSFSDNSSLEILKIPQPLKYITRNCLVDCNRLLSLETPSNWNPVGKMIFVEDCHLKSIILPSSIRKINGKIYQKKVLKSYDIPKHVTSLQDRCFKCCCDLTKITIPSTCVVYGKYTFNQCPLPRSKYPTIKENERKQLNLSPFHIQHLEKWTSMKMNQILFDDKDDSIFSLSRLIAFKKNIVFLFEFEKNTKIGCFISKQITDGGFLSDPNAFLFSIENDKYQQYPIKQNKQSEAISFQWSQYPSIQIGKEDINIISHFKGYFCSIHQNSLTSTYQYQSSKEVKINAIQIHSFKVIQFI